MKEYSRKKYIIVWSIVSIIFAMIYTLICKRLNVYSNNLDIERTIFIFAIIEFLGISIIVGFKEFFGFIIDKRYKIALICLVLLTILGVSGSSNGVISLWVLEPEKSNVIFGNYRGICSDEYGVELLFNLAQKNTGLKHFSEINGLTKTDMNISVHSATLTPITLFRIYNLGYLIFNSNMALSFAWNLKVIALLLVTYEFMIILIKDRKYLSLIGTVLICCSSFVNWWMSVDLIIFGELLLICIEKFMLSKNRKSKIIWSSVFAYSCISYFFSLYPAWMVSFGYIFLALAVWIIIKNRAEYKFEKFDLCCLIGIILICSIIGTYFYFSSFEAIKNIMQSSYPGARDEKGGMGIQYLFSYLYNFELSFGQEFDTKIVASFLSIFPISIIVAFIYVYKKEKHFEFIIPMLVVLFLESIWCMVGFPKFLAKITLFNLVPVERCAVAVSLGCIYLYMYMLANVEEKFIKQIHSFYIILAIFVIIYFVPVPREISSRITLHLMVSVIAVFGFLLLNIGNKKYNRVFLTLAVIFTLISGVTVNPVVIGGSTLSETQFAKKVKKELQKNSDEIWITEDMDMVVSNYISAQGAKTLNVTQTYPNDEFWQRILGDKKEESREIWNRFAHIRILLTQEESSVSLKAEDKIVLKLNVEKLNELGIKYIVSYKDLEEIWLNGISIKKIYEKKNNDDIEIEGNLISGIYIYEIVN